MFSASPRSVAARFIAAFARRERVGRSRRPFAGVLASLVMIAGFPVVQLTGLLGAVPAAEAAESVETITVSPSGGEAAGGNKSAPRDITADGRFVVFQANFTNLVAGGSSGHQVFARDRDSGVTELVSKNSSGTQADASHTTTRASISDDGRYVVFDSPATNLVAGDTNGVSDVFLHDRQTGTTSRVSVNSSSTQGDGASDDPVISADGRYVAFVSAATNLVASDTNSRDDVFVRDLQTGTTVLVSLTDSDAQITSHSENPSISADGRYVAFDTTGIGNGSGDDVYLRDRIGDSTQLMSDKDPVTSGGVIGHTPSISADGRFVAYLAFGSRPDIYLRDFATESIVRASVEADGSQGCCGSDDPVLSGDGRFVAFGDQSPLAPPDDDTLDDDVFVRDRTAQGGWAAPVPPERTYGPEWAHVGWQRPTTRLEADPVNTATGAFTSTVTDAVVASTGEAFSFTRSYTSSDTSSGALGVGWTHAYDASVTIDAESNAVVTAPGGARLYFTKQWDGNYRADPGIVADLEETASGWEVTTEDLRVFSFDTAGRLTAIADRNGEGLAFSYTSGNLTSIDTTHGTVTLGYDASNRLTSLTLPDSRSVSYGYDTSGRLSTVTDLRGNTTTYAYDSGDRLSKITDQNGHDVVTTVYDSSTGRVASQTDATGNGGSFTWDAAAEKSTYTDAAGNDWVDDYAGNVLQHSSDPLGNTTSVEYDSDLNPVAVTDPNGNTTTFEYDTAGRLTKATAPAPISATTTWTYNSLGLPATATDALNNTTTFSYDTVGNLTQVDAPEGATSSFTYTAEGLVDTGTDPNNHTTDFDYETDGDLASVTDPTGAKTTFSYDAVGRLTGVVEARGNEAGATPSDYRTDLAYNAADQPTTVTDPLGNTTTNAYDPAGNLTSVTDPNTHTTLYRYDDANRLSEVEAPDGSITEYQYTAVGDLKTRVDANTNTETYGYDTARRLVSRANPIGTWGYSHDPTGRITSVTPPGGGSIAYAWDALGRLSGVDYSDDTPDVAYAYDANGNRTAMTDAFGTVTYAYDDLHRLTALARGADTLTYAYDPASNVTSRTYPDGTTVALAHDPAGRLASIVEDGRATTYGYDPASNLDTTTLPNGVVETRTYDRAGRLTDIDALNGTTAITGEHLVYDPAGNPLQITDETGATTTHRYDTRNRLTHACFNTTTCTGAADFLTWTYDPVGNRLTETSPTGTTTYAYNTADQLTSITDPTGAVTAYAYDARGNQTQAGDATYQYDLADRMTRATVPGDPLTVTDYRYDGDGNRYEAAVDAADTELVTRRFTWDPNQTLPQLITEHTRIGDETATETLDRRYVHGRGTISQQTGDPVRAAAGDDLGYYHPDHLGSTQAVTDASGGVDREYDYEPYGTLRRNDAVDPTAIGNRLRYTGQYQDPTGLYHLRARQYDPTTGRFTATDPIAAPHGTPHYNAYSYVNNQPTIGTDPSGLICIFCAYRAAVAFFNSVGNIAGRAAAALTAMRALSPISGAIAGAFVGGSASLISQALSGNGIDWTQVAIDAASGALAGGLFAGTPTLVGAAAGALSSIFSQHRAGSVNWSQVGLSSGFGAIVGHFGNLPGRLSRISGRPFTRRDHFFGLGVGIVGGVLNPASAIDDLAAFGSEPQSRGRLSWNSK